MWLGGHKYPLCVTGTPLKESNLAQRGRICDMDQVPSVPNLLPGLGLLNLMIWAIIDERFEPISWSCEALIVFVSRVPSGIWEDRRFKDRVRPQLTASTTRTHAATLTDRSSGVLVTLGTDHHPPLACFDEASKRASCRNYEKLLRKRVITHVSHAETPPSLR